MYKYRRNVAEVNEYYRIMLNRLLLCLKRDYPTLRISRGVDKKELGIDYAI